MNAAADLQTRMNRAIPLGSAMGFRIAALGDHEISVEAPLAPNRNVHGTGFAGSLYGLGILTAWGLCQHQIERAGLDAELVVASAAIRYRVPVRSDIVCRSRMEPVVARAFARQLARRGRASIGIEVEIGAGPAALLEARMHASQMPAGRE